MRAGGFGRRSAGAFLGGICCAALASAPASAAEPDAQDLMKRTLEALPRTPFVARVKLTGDVRGKRELVVKHKIVEGARATYLEVVAPEFLVGMRFLFQERVGLPPVQYMRYVSTAVPVLIAHRTRAEPFLGSTFYLADLAEPELDAFTYTLVGNETVDGRACKLVEATPKEPEKEVYGKVIVTIDPNDLIILRRKFFDQEGHALKEWSATKVEKVDGNWTVRDQRMKFLPGNLESRIEMTEITYGAEIPDSVFTKENLAR